VSAEKEGKDGRDITKPQKVNILTKKTIENIKKGRGRRHWALTSASGGAAERGVGAKTLSKVKQVSPLYGFPRRLDEGGEKKKGFRTPSGELKTGSGGGRSRADSAPPPQSAILTACWTYLPGALGRTGPVDPGMDSKAAPRIGAKRKTHKLVVSPRLEQKHHAANVHYEETPAIQLWDFKHLTAASRIDAKGENW